MSEQDQDVDTYVEDEIRDHMDGETLKGLVKEMIKEVQRFVVLFPGWKNRMIKHQSDLNEIADSIDTVHKGATIGNIAGSSVAAVGGILSIGGLIAAPFTMGSSLLLTGWGAGIGLAGGAANIIASGADAALQITKSKQFDKIMEDYKYDSTEISICYNAVSTLPKDVLMELGDGFLKAAGCAVGNAARLAANEIAEIIVMKALKAAMRRIMKEAGNKAAKEAIRKTGAGAASGIAKEAARKAGRAAANRAGKEAMNKGLLPVMGKRALGALGAAVGVSGLLVIWDVYAIVQGSKELDDDTELAKQLRKIAQMIHNEVKKYEEIYNALNRNN